MKAIRNIIITLATSLVLAGAAKAAVTYTSEAAYVEAYSGRKDIPVPVHVVAPSSDYFDADTRVEVKFTVDANGKPENISFRTPVDKNLAESITAAVKEWKFEPMKVNGTPVSKVVVVPFVCKS